MASQKNSIKHKEKLMSVPIKLFQKKKKKEREGNTPHPMRPLLP